MAVWFFYVALLEDLFGNILVAINEGLRPAVDYLPVHAFNRLNNYLQHDPEAFQAAVARATEAGRDAPELLGTGAFVFATLAWITVFLVASFVWFRQRDL